MALNFPNNPNDNDTWIDPSNGAQYIYSETENAWAVLGISSGSGSVNSVNISGTNGIVTAGGPIIDVGTLTVTLDIDSIPPLP